MAIGIGVLAYVALQFAVGIWVSRSIRDEQDYVLGGRRLGVTLASFSVFATWFGAETVLGSSGSVYGEGLAGAQGEPFAYGVAILVMGALFAVPLRRRGFVTFGDFFRERFSPGVERLTVILLIPGSVLWAGAQVRGFGQVMSHTTGLDLWTAVTLAAVVVVAYTVFGGLLADVYTDFVQGIAIVAGLVAMFVAVAIQTGGPAELLASVDSARLRPMGPDQSLLAFIEQWAIPICGSLVAIELISRLLACRSPEVARRGATLGGVYYLVVAMIPVYFGFIGPRVLPGLEEPEQLSLALAQAYLPTIIYIMFAGALISAILSTVDSALLAAAALLSHNLVLRAVPTMSEQAKVRTARAGVAGLGLMAYGLALNAEGISDLVEMASAFASAGVFVAFALGMFTGIGGPMSALAALVLGSLVWVSGRFLLHMPAPYLSGVVAAAIGYLVVAAFERGSGGRRGIGNDRVGMRVHEPGAGPSL